MRQSYELHQPDHTGFYPEHPTETSGRTVVEETVHHSRSGGLDRIHQSQQFLDRFQGSVRNASQHIHGTTFETG